MKDKYQAIRIISLIGIMAPQIIKLFNPDVSGLWGIPFVLLLGIGYFKDPKMDVNEK